VSSDSTGTRPDSQTPAPAAPVRVRLRYAAFETFIEKFAPNVTRGGLFLASKTPRPVGEIFAFEVQLAGGEVALSGDGKVTWVREFDPSAPNKPHGMGVQFLRLDAPSREVVNQMLARKATGLTGPVPTLAASAGSARHRSGPNGVVGAARVDTNVDLAAEMGIDETRLKRAVERNWLGSARAAGEVDELEALLRPEPIETVSISQALNELPRLLDPPARRMSGAFRPLADLFPSTMGVKPIETPAAPSFGERRGDPNDPA
jgi:uncharacterized protein (TIGR02266 family)